MHQQSIEATKKKTIMYLQEWSNTNQKWFAYYDILEILCILSSVMADTSIAFIIINYKHDRLWISET